jgi:hypothetical protein
MFDRELAIRQLDRFWEGMKVSMVDMLGKSVMTGIELRG